MWVCDILIHYFTPGKRHGSIDWRSWAFTGGASNWLLCRGPADAGSPLLLPLLLRYMFLARTTNTFLTMPRKKAASRHIDKAQKRISGMKSIDENLDLGNGLTNVAYGAAITEASTKLDLYNQHLSNLDEKYNDWKQSEKSLRDLNERMLIGVAARYGKDSNEYEKAGGIKKSERKRPVRNKGKGQSPTGTNPA